MTDLPGEDVEEEEIPDGRFFWMESVKMPSEKRVSFDLGSVSYFQESEVYGGTMIEFKNGREIEIELPFDTFGEAFSEMLKESIIMIKEEPVD